MPDMIRDGSGRGYLAKVSSEQRLYTDATSKTVFADNSDSHKEAYMIYGKRAFAAADTDEGLLFITFNGTGSRHLHIDKIVFSGNSDINATPESAISVEVYVDSTYTSGGTSVTPINMNRTSGNVLEATCYNGTSAITATAGSLEILDVRGVTGSFVLDFGGALILGQDDTLYIQGKASNIADIARATIFCYVEDHS